MSGTGSEHIGSGSTGGEEGESDGYTVVRGRGPVRGGSGGRGSGYPSNSPGRGGHGNRARGPGQAFESRTCRACGEPGHIADYCPGTNQPSTAQSASNQSTAASLTPPVAQSTYLDSWHIPGLVSNTEHPPQQLIIQTAINHHEAGRNITDTMHDKGYQTDVADAGRPSTVLTNFLSIQQRSTTIFIYTIQFVQKLDEADKAILVTKRFDKEGLFTALRQRPGYSRLNTQANWVTDFTNIWSTTPLFDDLDSEQVPAEVDNLAGTNPNSNKSIDAKCGSIIFRRVIDLQKTIGQLYQDSSGRLKGDDDPALLQRGLNAIITRHAAEKAQTEGLKVLQSGANKFYDLDRGFYLDKYLQAYHGFFISVCPGAQQLLVNVNLRCSPFLEEDLRIADLIRHSRTPQKATSLLKGLKVRLLETAPDCRDEVEFVTEALSNQNVNVGRKPPHHPSIKKSHLMTTFAHSPYRQQLAPHQTINMIQGALKAPRQHIQELKAEAIQMLGLDDEQVVKCLRDNFGLVVQANLLKLPCRFLSPPGIKYASEVLRTKNASWNLQDQQVGQLCNTQIVEVLDLTDHGFNKDFEKMLQEGLRSIGIQTQVRQRQHLQTSTAPSALTERDVLNEMSHIVPSLLQRRSTSLVVVISKPDFDLYSTIKRVVDIQLGIQTTCVAANKIARLELGSSATIMHCANIGLKLNLKGDGYNHKIAHGNIRELYAPPNNNENLDDVECNTIVIGADVTHPMSHCASGCPSIAAVVGSVDNDFAKFPGSMRLQQSKKEVIMDLHDMVMERLLDWADKHDKKLPDSVLFYRDGVSESQFDAVRDDEIPQLQQAYDKDNAYLCQAKGETRQERVYSFRLTFVVVGKRHNTRFFPQKGAKAQDRTDNGNVTPGMVVDQVVTHPYIMDFYLQSHMPVRGTGRSAHYFVLQNNMALSSNRLQGITHAFCYNYARATKGVLYCGPAYYADRLCDRGRAYIRGWLMGRDNCTPSRNKTNTETDEAYNKIVADELYDSQYYRPSANRTQPWGRVRKNPWHPNLDGVMFYL